MLLSRETTQNLNAFFIVNSDGGDETCIQVEQLATIKRPRARPRADEL